MSFSFLNPAFVYAAAALLLLAMAGYWRRRRPSPALFVLGAASLCLLAAQPVMHAGGEPTHAAVLDVSGSMESRLREARQTFDAELEQSRARFRKQQLSDTLRNDGDPAGGRTNYAAVGALASDDAISGEVVVMTDGRGRLEELLGALDPSRVTLLRAPAPAAPDAAIISVNGPGLLLPGASASLRAEIRCDRDAEVLWRIHGADGEVAQGRLALKAGVAQGVEHSFVAPASGLLKLRLSIECANDRELRNNAASLAVAIGGKRVIHYARGRQWSDEIDALAALLRSDTLNELRVRPGVPASAAELEGVNVVILNDLALADSGVSREGLAPLARWVREGGRLLMAGARDSFGPGGWRGSALEDLMPVTFRPDDDKARRIVLLLDCSDSMRASIGGQTRLDLLKQAARRVLAGLGPRDFAAIAGFSEAPDAIEFRPLSERDKLLSRIDALQPRTTTRIRSALTAALAAFAEGASEQSRVMLITDGDDNEGGSAEQWQQLGMVAKARANVDVVLTEQAERDWLRQLRAGGARGANTSVGAGGFAELLVALEDALRASEEGLLDDGSGHGGFEIGGVSAKLAMLCRTAPRAELREGDLMLQARTPPGEWKAARWPLIARREMVGRSVALCTETSGEIWRDGGFLRVLSQALGFVLEGVERAHLQLNARESGAEIIWVGSGEAPEEDLRLSDGTRARLVARGRWELAEYPRGDEVQVFANDKLLQRVALAQSPPRELALTGDDEVFFAVAQQRGLRVVGSLADWKPARFGGEAQRNLSWLAGLLAAAFVLAGFALRRR